MSALQLISDLVSANATSAKKATCKNRKTALMAVFPNLVLAFLSGGSRRRRLSFPAPAEQTQGTEAGNEEWESGGQGHRRCPRHRAEGVIELELAAAVCRQREDDLNIGETATEQSADVNRAPG